MIDKERLEAELSALPLYAYFYTDPETIEFSDRIRWICQNECPMYGKSWACPPGVGEVRDCKAKCLGYNNCLVVGTITETESIADLETSLKTRPEHEAVTNQVRDMLRAQGERCAILDGEPCRMPERMHPCVESHGINIIPTLEENGLDFQYGGNIITWYSLLFFNE